LLDSLISHRTRYSVGLHLSDERERKKNNQEKHEPVVEYDHDD